MTWYYGPHPDKKMTFTVLQSRTTPTKEKHGHVMKFACGPCQTRQAAMNDARYCFTFGKFVDENGKEITQ